LRFMQRRMKIGFTTMSDAGYIFYKVIPEDSFVSVPRLSEDVYRVCRAIVLTLSNAPRSLQTDEVANAIVAANDATIKQARFYVRMYCTRADLSVPSGRDLGTDGESSSNRV